MKKIVLLLAIVAIVLSFSSCDEDIADLINRIPYDIELWHEHTWNNWQASYDEENLTLVCEVCEAEVKSYPISEGLEIDENGVLIGKGSCTDEYIAVPHGVTAIGEEAFSNDKDIKALFLPNTVTKIESRAFKNCDGLQVINIPNGVTELGDDSFFACKSVFCRRVSHR